MDDAALRLLDSLRDPAGGFPSAAALEAFARLLAGPGEIERARRWAAAAITDAPRLRARAEAFRLVFEAAQTHGQRIDITDRTVRRSGALVLEGVFTLPVRERAVLALSCVLGFTIGEVAHVIDADPSSVRRELEKAVVHLRLKADEEQPGHVA